jgi:hypothetical protein
MFFPPGRTFYYSAAKLDVEFVFAERVETVVASGTCFFISKNNSYFLVTNRHNVDYSYSQKRPTGARLGNVSIKCWGVFVQDGALWHSKNYTIKIDNPNIPVFVSENEAEDIAVIPFGRPNEDFCVIDYEVLGSSSDFNNTNPGEPLIMFGYSCLSNAETGAPIARTGIFASDPTHDYRRDGDNHAKHLAIEVLSTSGMSGSPVFALQRGIEAKGLLQFEGFRRMYLAGVNAGHYHEPDRKLGMIHGHMGWCVKSTVIRQLIDLAAQ